MNKIEKGQIRLVVLLGTFWALFSCAPTKYVASGLTGLRDVAVISPYAYIEQVDRDSVFYDDSISRVCAAMTSNALIHSPMSTGTVIPVELGGEDPTYSDAIAYLADIVPDQAGLAPIPAALDELLEAYGQRYGIVVYASGYAKTPRLYGREVAATAGGVAASVGLSVLMAVASFGTFYSVPIVSVPQKNMLFIRLAVIDSQEDRFVYYKLIADSVSPTNHKFIEKKIRKALGKLAPKS